MSANPPSGVQNPLDPSALERRILELEIKWKIAIGVATVLGFSLAGVLIFALTTTKGLNDASDAVHNANKKISEARADLEMTRTTILRSLKQEELATTSHLAVTVEAALKASRDNQVSEWLADERKRRERHDAIQDCSGQLISDTTIGSFSAIVRS